MRTPGPDKLWIGGVLVFLALSWRPVCSAGEDRAGAIDVGQAYPDFRLPKLDGSFGRLSDYRGDKVLLIHFASW